MARKIKIDGMADAIERELKAYADDVHQLAAATTTETARKAVEEIKANSPVGKGRKKGAYKRGWKATIESDRIRTNAVVSNTQWQLTHLLENGHALRQGGRAPAIPHIQPVADKVEEAFIKILEGKL